MNEQDGYQQEHLRTALEERAHVLDARIYDDAVCVLRGDGASLPRDRARRACVELAELAPRVEYLTRRRIIKLTPAEVMIDDQEAHRDHNRATAGGWHGVGYDPGTPEARLAYKIQSHRSERAFAKYIGATDWVRDPDGFRVADVNGWSVRLASQPGYGLVTHDRDEPHPYVLMEDECVSGLVFRVAKWIPYEDAVALYMRKIGSPLPGSTRPWCIPQDYLREWPPEELSWTQSETA